MAVYVDTLNELREKRNALYAKLQALGDKVKTENDGRWTPENRVEFENIRADATKANQVYKDYEGDYQRNQDIENLNRELDEGGDRRRTTPTGSERNQKRREKRGWNSKTADRALRDGSIHNRIFQNHEDGDYPYQSDEYDDAFNRMLKGQNKHCTGLVTPSGPKAALRSDSEQDGGYFVASETFVEGILKNVDDEVFIQKNSRVFLVDGYRNLGVRKRLAKANSFIKGQELTDITASFDSSLKWGKRYLTPHYFVGGIQISNDLLRNSFMPVESMVRDELMINLREFLEYQYLYGNGDQGPLGIMVPSAEGLPTSRDSAAIDADVNTGGGEDSTTHFGANSLIRAKFDMKPQYRDKSRWMWHTNTLERIATMRDGEGRPLWRTSDRDGEPDKVLGLPYDENLWMPSATGAGLYYAILANWEWYWIAWGMQLEARRLVEIAARTNQTEYHWRGKVDAMCMKDEAFVRCAYAAA